MIKVLQYLDSLDWKGEEMVIMNYYRKIDTTKIQFDFITRSQPGCRFQEEIAARGGKVFFLPSREKHPVEYVRAFRKVLREGKYDVLHINKSGASLVIDAMIGKSSRVPVIMAHSHNSFCSGLMLHKICKLFVNKFIDYRLACSAEAGEWIFGNREDIKIINNAIDMDHLSFSEENRIRYRAELGINDNFVVGFVGRLEHQKNPLRLLDIFREVAAKKENAVLLIVGDGSLRQQMEERVASYGMKDRVLFLGKRNDVSMILSAMDVFLLVSHYEGLPIVLVEAQTNGLETICSDSIPKIDLTGRNCVISLEEKDAVWAERIISCCRDSDTDVTQMITDGGYNLSCEAKKLEKFYEQAVATACRS